MNLGGARYVVLYQVHQLEVSKEHADQIEIDVPWWIEDNGILVGHRERMLHRGFILRNCGNHFSLEGILTLKFEDHEVQLHGLDIEVVADADNGTISHSLGVRDTSHTILVVLPSDKLSSFESFEINLKLFLGVGGANKCLVVG